MKTDNTIIDKYIDIRLSEEEEQRLHDWFEIEGGREYISQKITEDSENLSPEIAQQWVDHPIASERMKERFLEHIRKETQKQQTLKWLRVAAVIVPFVVLCGALTFLVNRSGIFRSPEYAEFNVPYGEQMQVALQDGSVVMLNSGSYLRYPKSFGLFKREVKLSGEGYFSIEKDKKRPFVVDLNGVDIRVTGTEFNVKAYQEENIIFVTLTKGKVYLQDLFNKKYTLVEGETAVYNRESAACQISHTKDESAVTAWRFKSLNFYQTPLKEVVKVLERQYNVQFIAEDPSILEHRFTISTSKRQVEDILKDLEKVSRVRFNSNENGDFVITDTQ